MSLLEAAVLVMLLLLPGLLHDPPAGHWSEIADWYPVSHRSPVIEAIPNRVPPWKWLDGARLWQDEADDESR